jgi:hypothetical protein
MQVINATVVDFSVLDYSNNGKVVPLIGLKDSKSSKPCLELDFVVNPDTILDYKVDVQTQSFVVTFPGFGMVKNLLNFFQNDKIQGKI